MTGRYPYGLIGNCMNAALISTDGAIDWLCMPYLDSPSAFGALLDTEKGGSFRIDGVDVIATAQEYIGPTPILKTRVETKDGVYEIVDYMPRFVTEAKEHYCPSEVQRLVRVISGHPRIRVTLDLRPNYGASACRVEDFGEYLKFLSMQGEYHSYYLYTNAAFTEVTRSTEFAPSGTVYFTLSYHQKIRPFDLKRAELELEKTRNYWLEWSKRTELPKKYGERTLRSMITLKLLMYQRTGAVIAAPTTSLPEIIGKERNWDYRYCWIRDASMIIELFGRLGHVESATRYMNFILDRMLLKNSGIAVMYGIHGEKILTEKKLTHLTGHAGSQPVRIGNDAYLQTQNDLAGELLEAITVYFEFHNETGFHFDEELWTAVRSLVSLARATWEKPDNGIWEYRGGVQHHVFSKLMNWVAMDRGGKIARLLGKKDYAKDCFALADTIKADILEKGWNPAVQAFTMHYGSTHADAAVLMMLHYGFLPKDDPRLAKTVDFCRKELVRDGFAMRYTADDDFGKPENAFLICTFWMVNALYLVGRKKESQEMFDHALDAANHVGLMSEGLEPATRRQTGNFPQGYSHMAFIQSALLLETDYMWGPPKIKATERDKPPV